MKILTKKHKLALKMAWVKRKAKGLGTAWNKGQKMSDSHKANLKKAWVARKEKGLGNPWNKGKHLSKEHAEKCRIARLGAKDSLETRIKKSVCMVGKLNHNYKHGKCRDTRIHYNDLRYKLWREKVYKRDNWTCQNCFKRGCYLEAHHIKGWAEFPKLRYVVSNGITLCKECHKKTDNYCGRKKKRL